MLKIAVLISTYNGQKYLKEQIESILNQEGDFSIDIYVRDDGSNDDTIQIIKKYKCIKYYVGENLHSAKSFIDLLFSINYEEYDYFAFSDQDDVWLPNKIVRQIESIKDFDIPMISLCNSFVVDCKLNNFDNRLLYANSPITDPYSISCSPGIQGCACLFNKHLMMLIRNNPKPSVVIMHDSYIARVCTACSGEIKFIETPLLLYRQHENNVVGVKRGLVTKIKYYFNGLFKLEIPGISEQCKEIFNIYYEYMSDELREWYRFLSQYKYSLRNKIRLATTNKIIFISKKWSFYIRIKCLLGKK